MIANVHQKSRPVKLPIKIHEQAYSNDDQAQFFLDEATSMLQIQSRDCLFGSPSLVYISGQ
jgi:hypothetical protein